MKGGFTSMVTDHFFCQPGISCRDPCFACLAQDNMDHHHLCCTLDIPVDKCRLALGITDVCFQALSKSEIFLPIFPPS